MAQDHQYPLATRAPGRLDAEARPILDHLGDASHLVLEADGADKLWHCHPGIDGDAFGLELVIHQRIEGSGVVAPYVADIVG